MCGGGRGARRARGSAARAVGLAAARGGGGGAGGVCLSTAYVNNKAPLEWRCAAGHEWAAPANNVCRAGGGAPGELVPDVRAGGGVGCVGAEPPGAVGRGGLGAAALVGWPSWDDLHGGRFCQRVRHWRCHDARHLLYGCG
eukprot:TRINITY_DN8811_c0_g1_i1.p1 TRINITY_DN8811_c0_g1~~TRINITY_DN8811_c0_g1_i1.p1  ORF type:complete len:141 (-),score=26.53 TRINITY_DN8811_c0_g1_i1:224-646(-)